MSSIAELASRFVDDERGVANLLDLEAVQAQAIAAASFYAGYAELATPADPIDAATDITVSEWALIRPLFMLYAERETALQLEATRGMGADVFGRSTSEISTEIQQLEADLPRRAFCRDVVTV